MLVAIIGLVVLSLIVLAHELGHFFTAKASGVKVEEFGFGFPPRLWGIRRGETLYSLNAIPFGAFTKLSGEEDPRVPRSLAGKGISTRLLVLSAGSLTNLLLALLLFSVTNMLPHDTVIGQVSVEEVAPDSPAARAGIKPGDTLLSVNSQPLNHTGDLHRYIQLNLGKEITLLVQHPDSTKEKVRLTPRWKPPVGQGAIGVAVRTLMPTIVRHSYPWWQAIPLGVRGFTETLILYKNGIISLIMGVGNAQFVGPVGIAQITGEVAVRAGMGALLEFTAFISFLLGLFNLFPLPALDGGRIAFVLLEWVRRGKRVPARTEGLIHFIGFAMLIAFALAITYQDIIRIISGGSMIP